MLTDPPSAPRRSRTKRREEFLRSIATLIGCGALVLLIATMFYVVAERAFKPMPLDKEHIDAVYGTDERSTTWSGIETETPALLARKPKPQLLPQKGAAPAETTSAGPLADGAAAGVPAAVDPPKALPAYSGISNLEAKRPAIEEAVRGFFAAGSVDTKLTFVRDPGRVKPLMADYYSRQPMSKVVWRNLGWTLPVEEPGFRFGYVQAEFQEGAPVSLIVEEMDNGSFRVDWESSVRYGELNWQDFLRVKPVKPTLFRVIASKARTSVPDDLPRISEMLEIKHPAEDGVVYASFDKTDPQLAPLVQQLKTGNWKDVPVTLRLCYPGPSSDGTSVRIAGVEGKGWLILQPTRS